MEEEENGAKRKDRSFLGRLRDCFTLPGLAEHLKENRYFARVGEEDRDGMEGIESLKLKPQTNPTPPQLMMAHAATTLMTLVAVLLQSWTNFGSSLFFSPCPPSSSQSSCPFPVILHPSFCSLSIVDTRPSAALASSLPEGRCLVMRYQSRA